MQIVPCYNRNNTYDEVQVYDMSEYTISDNTYNMVTKRSKYGKIQAEYVNHFATLDSETTSISHYDENGKEVANFAFTYIWAVCFNGDCLTCRTTNNLIDFLKQIKPYYGLKSNQYFVIYVQNLSFEFQFLNQYIKDYTGVFAIDTRKILTWRCKDLGIEFRDSLRQTNTNLNKATRDCIGVLHIKASGDLDYSKIRHCQTDMTDTELGYVINDVLGLWELETYKLANEGYTIATTPMTSTGYVRNDMRKATQTLNMRNLRKKLSLDKKLYEMCRKAFRGGDTHANKFMAGIIHKFVYSFDAVSMYPAMQMLRKFPMTRFEKLNVAKEYQLKYLKKHEGQIAWIGTLKLENIKCKSDCYNPYLSISKCEDLINEDYDNDNGRIWETGSVNVTITDVDWQIIKECYDIENVSVVDDIYISYYDYLPKEVTGVIMEYFKAKTVYKDLCKVYEVGSKELEEAEQNLMIAKQKLNGIYGMSATEPVRDEILFDGLSWTTKKSENVNYEKLTSEGVMPYVWGVWTTAWAREHLRKILKAAENNYIYCDTDSCKALMFDFNKIDEINKEVFAQCEERGCFVVRSNGKKAYMGYFECESHLKIDGQKYTPEYYQFITLGAKKYAYDEYKSDGTTVFGITISGVRHKEGVDAIKQIENFKPNFKIKDSGGQNATYYDSDILTKGKIVDYTGKSGDYEFYSFVCLTHREYEIGITSKQMLDYTGLRATPEIC